MRKAIGLIAAFAAISSVNVQAGSTAQINQQTNKEVMQPLKYAARPMSFKDDYGGFGGGRNPYKHVFSSGNQRQYRKWMRQVPQMRKSKKHR